MKLPQHLSPKERRAIKRTVQELATKFPAQIRFIALFGSKARGDFAEHSDIDLLIVGENDDWRIRDKIRIPVYDADLDCGTFTSPWVIGWERFQTLPTRRPGLFASLCRDAIELWRRPGTENPLKSSEIAPPVMVAA